MIEAHSRGAWRDLAVRLRSFVARRVPPSDVDDVVQDVFVRMQRGLTALRNDDRFGAWIYQVARSAIADHRRSRARHPLSAAEPAELGTPAEDENTDRLRAAAELGVQVVLSRLQSPR